MRSGLSVTTLRTLAKFLQAGQSRNWHKQKKRGHRAPFLKSFMIEKAARYGKQRGG
jgi:hypothetical protein